MVIKWTPLSKEQLQNFMKISKAEKHNIIKYVIELVNYTDSLLANNQMGKVLFILDKVEFRQLLYKKHRIIYYIKENEIQVISVIHTSQNLDKAINVLQKLYK